MKNILVIQGHPSSDSFCHGLGDAYVASAQNAGDKITYVKLSQLKFDPILRLAFNGNQELEPDLQFVQKNIVEADHIVFIYPNWWGNPPALLKGLIDRVFLPGFAFKYTSGMLPEKLLKGKTSEIILTLDTPPWFYRLFLGAPGLKIMTRDVLRFCGIKNIRTTLVGPIRGSSDSTRADFIDRISKIAKRPLC